MTSNKIWSEPGSKNSLLSEVVEPKIENNTSLLDHNNSKTQYNEFEDFIVSKVQEKKAKLKNNIDVIKKTSSWNQERTKLFLNYLDETINSVNHLLSE